MFYLSVKKLFSILINIISKIVCSVKLICRLIINKVFNIVVDVGQETGILALKLIVSKSIHIIERVLWLCAIVFCFYSAFILSNVQVKRFNNSPTVISVDRNYRGWSGYLPAVTICYYEHVDAEKMEKFILNTWNRTVLDDDYLYFAQFIYAIVNATARNYEGIARYAEDERLDSINMYDTIRAIEKQFEQVFTTFDVNFLIDVHAIVSERGPCYAINSPISQLLNGTHIEFKNFKKPLICQFGQHQCFVRMDLYESTGIIDVHSPFEVSVLGPNNIPLQKLDEWTASYKLMETVSSNNIRDLSVKQRKCVFNDEMTSNLKTYSKTLCLLRCRAVMALEMCNCIPFFYQFIEGPRCSPAGFECLSDFKWPIWAIHVCKCPNTCNELEYTVQTVKRSTWGVNSNENGAATASFRWDLIPPKIRMRRDVVFTFEDLLVSFGGTVALLLGFSLVSITQFGFVLTIHFVNGLLHLLKLSRRIMTNLWRRCEQKELKLKRKQLLLNFHRKYSKNSNVIPEDVIDANLEDGNEQVQSYYEFLN